MLDELEEEITSAKRRALGGGIVLDRRRLLEIVEQLRLAIPANIRQARGIIEQGEQAVADAEAAAARIIADAQREAEGRINQAAVMRTAQERAGQLEQETAERARRLLSTAEADSERRLAEASARARAQEEDADRYALAILDGLEDRLSALLDSVRDGKAQLTDSR